MHEFFIIISGIVLAESIAQNNLKADCFNRMIIGMTFYVLVGGILYIGYQKYPLNKINVVWSCMSIILATLLGYFLYEEGINQNSIIAMVLALLAVYFSCLD